MTGKIRSRLVIPTVATTRTVALAKRGPCQADQLELLRRSRAIQGFVQPRPRRRRVFCRLGKSDDEQA